METYGHCTSERPRRRREVAGRAIAGTQLRLGVRPPTWAGGTAVLPHPGCNPKTEGEWGGGARVTPARRRPRLGPFQREPLPGAPSGCQTQVGHRVRWRQAVLLVGQGARPGVPLQRLGAGGARRLGGSDMVHP